ncbi:MAG: glycosyltransferase family 61 protein [Sphingobacteriales bacterium]|nr:glycosyltransferase family 61 protein [Sphingobacteriales bacterium]
MKSRDITLLKPSIEVEHDWPVNMAPEDLDDFEKERKYRTDDSFLKCLGKARVSSNSVIYKNGILVKESLVLPAQRSYYQYRYLAKKLFFSKGVTLAPNKKYLLVTDNWSAGHFHWFCDVLPKLLCIKDRAGEFVLLLQDVPYLRTIGLESLEMLGLNFDEIVWMKDTAFYKVPGLYYISRMSVSGHMHPGVMKELRKTFLPETAAGKKNIYITRNKAIYRRVVNEDEFCKRLKDYDFEIYIGEDHSLKEQAQIFSTAKTLIGVHGAGLANCIFMHPGGNVIELRKKENGPSNVGFWHLADSLGHRYYYFNGIPDSAKPLVGRGCNLTIPVNEFDESILKKTFSLNLRY